MPIELKALKGIDRLVVAYGAALVFAIAGIVGLNWHLGTLRAAFTERQEERTQMELEAESIVLPTQEERSRWTTDRNLMASMLLGEREIPTLLEQVTRLARTSRVEFFGLTPEEYVLDDNAGDLSGVDAAMAAVGIRRYMRFTVESSADYRSASEFIQEIGSLPRLAEFVSIQLTRRHPSIDVTMTFRVYQSEPAA